MKQSNKLSNYIKCYYKKNQTYPPTTINFYKYGRLIGQGAFGKVNIGLNVLSGRVVAIKSFTLSIGEIPHQGVPHPSPLSKILR